MKERGYDISKARIKRLTKKAADSADKVVLLFGKKHLGDAPSYLKSHPSLELWEVDSISDETPSEEYCALERARIGRIERRVNDLVRRLESSA
jgi:protein-tyrosine-phosphatase